MSPAPFHLLVHHIRRLAGPATAPPADGELLRRFARQGDEAAFEELLSRHGPRVLGVCRRLLHREQDVEDVFQATFLVLARQARKVRKPEAVGCYLHGVAARLALKAHRAATRAAGPLPEDVAGRATGPLDEVTLREARAIVEEELASLPERYRRPLVLCYLEGRTRDEAARALGWSLGTLKRRLEQGRAALGARLTHRGMTLSGALLAALCTPTGAEAAVPAALAGATLQRAAGQTVPHLISASAVLTAKSKGAALLLALILAAAGAIALGRPRSAQEPPHALPTPPAAKAEEGGGDRLGDPLPPGARLRLGTTRLRHEMFSFAFSPDGKQVASAGRDGIVRLWDLATGKEVRSFPGHRMYAYSVAFSPDGKLLASGDVLHVHLWDRATGKKLRTLSPFEPEPGKPKRGPRLFGIHSLAFSPDGKTLLVGEGDDCLGRWDVSAGRRLERIEGEAAGYRCTTYLADGKTIFSDGRGKICLLTEEGKVLHQLPLGSPSELYGAAVTRDGKWLAYGGPRHIVKGQFVVRVEGVLSLWDVSREKEVRRLELPVPVYAVAISPDGKTLAYVQDRTIHLVELMTGKEVRRLESGELQTLLLEFSPDGKTLAAHGRGSLQLWEAATGRPLLQRPGHSAAVVLTAFTPDGKGLLTAGGEDQTACLWDTATGHRLARWPGEWAQPFTLSLEGPVVLACAGPNRIGRWDTATGRRLPDRRVVEQPPSPFAHYRMALGLTPDRRTLVSVSDNNRGDGAATIVRQGVESGKVLLRRPHRFLAVRGGWPAPVLSPDCRLLAEVDESLIRLRDVTDGTVRRTLRTDGPEKEALLASSLVFAPGGRLLACAGTPQKSTHKPGPNRIHLWELATAKELATIPVSYAPRLAFSADGLRLASAAHDYEETRQGEPRIHLWSAAKGRQLAEVGRPDAFVSSLAFSPDGRTLATGLTNSTVLLWDLRPALGHAARIPGPEELERHWQALGAEDARAAYAAVEALSAAPAEAVSFLRERLRPAAGVKAERVRQLIADLDSDQFAGREGALEALEKLDGLVESALEELLRQGPSLECRRRAERLLEKIHGPPWTPEARRAVRAVAVLEAMGTAEARRLLGALAEGAPGARLSREAALALEWLQER